MYDQNFVDSSQDWPREPYVEPMVEHFGCSEGVRRAYWSILNALLVNCTGLRTGRAVRRMVL